MFKYFLCLLLILVCLVVLQRGCKGIGERWNERMEEFRERRENRKEERQDWWQGRRRDTPVDPADDDESKKEHMFERRGWFHGRERSKLKKDEFADD